MATAYPSPFSIAEQSASYDSIVPEHLDLIRRYCPEPAQHTPEQIATCIWQITERGCWLWAGPYTPDGYGYVWCEPTPYGYRESVRVHRYFYDIMVGEILAGIHIHHRCKVTACFNPLHLKAVTPLEHVAEHGRAAKLKAIPWAPPVQLTLPLEGC
jgi:hypothetical protein